MTPPTNPAALLAEAREYVRKANLSPRCIQEALYDSPRIVAALVERVETSTAASAASLVALEQVNAVMTRFGPDPESLEDDDPELADVWYRILKAIDLCKEALK